MNQETQDKIIDLLKQFRKAKTSDVASSVFIAQSIYETGWFRSKLCTESNNYFGIKYVGQPEAKGRSKVNGKFANYSSLEDSVSDRLRVARIKTPKYNQFTTTENVIGDVLDNGYIGYNPPEKDYKSYYNSILSICDKTVDPIVSNYEEIEEVVIKVPAKNKKIPIIGILILIGGIVYYVLSKK